MDVIINLKEVIAFCETAQDYETREFLESLLKETQEDHSYWLEQQLSLIEDVGIKNYLQSQI